MDSERTHLELKLSGHLTEAALAKTLAPVSASLNQEPACLLVNALEMAGYDAGARTLFVQWNRDHRRRIHAVAILTDNTAWRMVIAAMAFASGQTMKAFARPEDALRWFDEFE